MIKASLGPFQVDPAGSVRMHLKKVVTAVPELHHRSQALWLTDDVPADNSTTNGIRRINEDLKVVNEGSV